MLVYVKTWSVRCSNWNHIAVVSVVLVLVFLWIIQQEELMGQHPSGVTRTSYLGSSSRGIRVIRVRVIGVPLYISRVSRVWSVNSLLGYVDRLPPRPPPFPPHLSPDISINVLRAKLREFDKRSKRFPVSDRFINSHNLFKWLCMDIVRRKLMLITLGLIKHYLKFTYQESASQSLIPALKKKTAKTDLTFVDKSHSQ